ncbi:hypothetical protein GHT06_008488 [Daphnia sinensis]|uniref:Uncharacterized protein n=1 Tax=Daphnia sinensis TaxID=1820382 RepID=A0AAD5L2B1_9CRUS|nr:hypothetical protein GHT06_008488 [Daphnia sinensis]
MLRKIGNTESSLEFVCKEVMYHNSCRKKYSYEARASLMKKESERQSHRLNLREIKEKAFETTVQFIQSHVLEKREVHRVSDISNQYRMLLCGHELDYHYAATHRRYLFLEKLNSHFGDKLKTINHPSKGVGKIIFSSEMSTEQAILTSFDMSFSAVIKVKEAAFLLRNLILKAPRSPLPKKLKVKHIIEGEMQPPELLIAFFECLISGKSLIFQRLINVLGIPFSYSLCVTCNCRCTSRFQNCFRKKVKEN